MVGGLGGGRGGDTPRGGGGFGGRDGGGGQGGGGKTLSIYLSQPRISSPNPGYPLPTPDILLTSELTSFYPRY